MFQSDDTLISNNSIEICVCDVIYERPSCLIPGEERRCPLRLLPRVQALQEVRPRLHQVGEEDDGLQRKHHFRQDGRNLKRYSVHVPTPQRIPDCLLHLRLQVRIIRHFNSLS